LPIAVSPIHGDTDYMRIFSRSLFAAMIIIATVGWISPLGQIVFWLFGRRWIASDSV
jgi:hypothetical protein